MWALNASPACKPADGKPCPYLNNGNYCRHHCIQLPKKEVKLESEDIVVAQKLEGNGAGAAEKERKYKRKYMQAKVEIKMLQRKIKKLKKSQKELTVDDSDLSSEDSTATAE